MPRREPLLGTGGIWLALAPYAFFQLTFGSPSVIARDFNGSNFITGARPFSPFLNLNQGMIIGIAATPWPW